MVILCFAYFKFSISPNMVPQINTPSKINGVSTVYYFCKFTCFASIFIRGTYSLEQDVDVQVDAPFPFHAIHFVGTRTSYSITTKGSFVLSLIQSIIGTFGAIILHFRGYTRLYFSLLSSSLISFNLWLEPVIAFVHLTTFHVYIVFLHAHLCIHCEPRLMYPYTNLVQIYSIVVLQSTITGDHLHLFRCFLALFSLLHI